MAPAIEAQGLSLSVRLPDLATWSIKEFVVHGLRRRIAYHEIWPVRDVTLSIEPGELMGVIGRNGAGKTTLMKLVSGILVPTRGRVIVRGRITPVLGLGTGLDPELTGRENIVLLGALLGRDPRRLQARANEIAEWAELREYLDVPLRTYSAGMSARLAFAIVTDDEPEILLLDEILAVGDGVFQDRAHERIRDLIRGGSTVLLVSHDLEAIEQWSTRVVWLESGQVAGAGEPAAVVAQYTAHTASSHG